jgi:hypothetical protein
MFAHDKGRSVIYCQVVIIKKVVKTTLILQIDHVAKAIINNVRDLKYEQV